MRKRTSVIWGLPSDRLQQVVRESTSLAQVLRFFELEGKGGNHKTLKRRLAEEQIDFSHIKLGTGSNLGRNFERPSVPLEEVMVENSSYSRGHLKRRIIQAGLLNYSCAECGQLPEWREKTLVLILDHINGISNDHRLENLQFLCPNCNSQTKTFAGRNRRPQHQWHCKNCGNPISGKGGTKKCRRCISLGQERSTNRPSLEVLLKQIEELGYRGTGRLYGVSDNAIRKWVRAYQT